MISKRNVIAVSLLLFLMPGVTVPDIEAAYEIEFPDPPEGFTWRKIKPIKAAFLVPDGWHFKAEKVKGTLAYFITAESIDDDGRFDTGLSINVMPHLKGQDAVTYAQSFVISMGEGNELVRNWETGAGVLKGFGCLTRNPGDDNEPTIMMSTLAIGNETTNTLYIMWFESLESEWESAWKLGEKIMEFFFIDDEV